MKNVRDIIQNYESLFSEAQNLQAQIAELTLQKRRLEMEMQEIEEDIKSDMISGGLKRVKVAGWKINLSNSTSTVIEAEDLLPEIYWRIEKKPDLMRVKEAIKNGVSVEGARLIIRQNISMKKP